MSELNERLKKEIENNYYNDVRYNIRSKSRWKFIGDFSESISYFFTGIATILSFACGFFDNFWLAFVSGIFGTISLMLLKFSSYAMKESKERADQVNIILDDLGVKEIVSVV